MISVVVSTINRPNKIARCLNSILDSTYTNFEIIVVDQSNDSKTKKIIEKLRTKKIYYYQIRYRGLSRARNFGIRKARGNIIAFTDDDCISHTSWLETITEAFQSNKDAVGVFGKTLPYHPERHMGQQCPSLFSYPEEKLILAPVLHWKFIGLGNNMAFDRKVFTFVGGFKEWLGHGSIGMSADDGEFSLRLLTKGYNLFYTPKAKIFHNRWLSQEQAIKLYQAYACGEMACYGYFLFQGYQFSKSIIYDNISNLTHEAEGVIKSLLSFDKMAFNKFLRFLSGFYAKMRGLLVGLYYSRFDPLR